MRLRPWAAVSAAVLTLLTACGSTTPTPGDAHTDFAQAEPTHLVIVPRHLPDGLVYQRSYTDDGPGTTASPGHGRRMITEFALPDGGRVRLCVTPSREAASMCGRDDLAPLTSGTWRGHFYRFTKSGSLPTPVATWAPEMTNEWSRADWVNRT